MLADEIMTAYLLFSLICFLQPFLALRSKFGLQIAMPVLGVTFGEARAFGVGEWSSYTPRGFHILVPLCLLCICLLPQNTRWDDC